MKSNFEIVVRKLNDEEITAFKRFCRDKFKVRKNADLRNLSPSTLNKYLRLWKEKRMV